jgi:hypothetical protein
LTSFIKRCGPFKAHSMAVFERFHTLFKRLARARNGHLMANILNNYSMVVNGDTWRQQMTNDGFALTSTPTRSSASSRRKKVDFADVSVEVNMPRKGFFDLDDRSFDHLRDVWAIMSPEYSNLRLRYRAEARSGGHAAPAQNGGRQRKKARLSRAAVEKLQIPFGWTPRTGPQLSSKEILMTKTDCTVRRYKKATINNKFEFRTMKSQETNANDDSAVKVWYDEPDGTRTAAYGWIKSIFTHSLYAGGPATEFLQADWADTLEDPSKTGHVQIEWNSESNFNLCCSIVTIADIVPYNLAFLPVDIKDQDLQQCVQYVVLDPELRLGKHLP